MSQEVIVLVTLLTYKLALIGIGLWVSRRNRSEDDYFLGGRALGPVVSGLSYAASTSSAWVLLGFSGFVFAIGVSALWMVPGIWAGYAVVWLVFGERLRRESAQHGQITLADFMLQDAADASDTARRPAAWVAALLILICFVFYIAAQFDAAGIAIAQHFRWSAEIAVVVGAAIVLTYALIGGFWAVSITDTLQAVVMLLVALLVPASAVIGAGGFAAVWDLLRETMPAAYLSFAGGHAPLILLGFVLGTVGMSLGALGQPHLLTRLMSVREERARKQGFVIAIFWGVLVFLGMTVLGLAARALSLDLANQESIFYAVAAAYLPPVLGGIVIAATLSAVMSTVDSVLLAASAAVAHDFGINRRFRDREVMISRVVMALIASAAVLLTLSLPDTIFNRVLFAWSALGAAFGPIVVWRVLGRAVTGRAALCAMLAGFGVTVLFFLQGASPPRADWLSTLAHLPGDPFERVAPWVAPLIILASPLNRPSR